MFVENRLRVLRVSVVNISFFDCDPTSIWENLWIKPSLLFPRQEIPSLGHAKLRRNPPRPVRFAPHRHRFAIVTFDNPPNDLPCPRSKPHRLPHAKHHHLVVAVDLPHEPQTCHDDVVQLNQLLFRQPFQRRQHRRQIQPLATTHRRIMLAARPTVERSPTLPNPLLLLLLILILIPISIRPTSRAPNQVRDV